MSHAVYTMMPSLIRTARRRRVCRTRSAVRSRANAAPTPDPYALPSDDEVALPSAPPPDKGEAQSGGEDSDDDIVMPAGPPPGKPSAPMPVVQPRVVAQRPQPEEVAPVAYARPAKDTHAPEHAPPRAERGPAAPPSTTPSAPTDTLSAAPQMRDFKRDATAFVPASVRKKQRR